VRLTPAVAAIVVGPEVGPDVGQGQPAIRDVEVARVSRPSLQQPTPRRTICAEGVPHGFFSVRIAPPEENSFEVNVRVDVDAAETAAKDVRLSAGAIRKTGRSMSMGALPGDPG